MQCLVREPLLDRLALGDVVRDEQCRKQSSATIGQRRRRQVVGPVTDLLFDRLLARGLLEHASDAWQQGVDPSPHESPGAQTQRLLAGGVDVHDVRERVQRDDEIGNALERLAARDRPQADEAEP